MFFGGGEGVIREKEGLLTGGEEELFMCENLRSSSVLHVYISAATNMRVSSLGHVHWLGIPLQGNSHAALPRGINVNICIMECCLPV